MPDGLPGRLRRGRPPLARTLAAELCEARAAIRETRPKKGLSLSKLRWTLMRHEQAIDRYLVMLRAEVVRRGLDKI